MLPAAAAKSLQLCLTLCDPTDSSPPGSPVPGILQARTLEWVAISFSNAWKWKVKVKSLSRVGLLATPWTAAHQAPRSMGFSRQEYWRGVPLPSQQCYLQGFWSVAPVPSEVVPFVYLASVCRSLQCLISALTQAGGGGLLVRFAGSVALRGGRGAADRCHWPVWGALAVFRPHWVCPRSRLVLFPSTLIGLQAAL